ncbi:NAD(P)-dependent malic enzyme [Candidatus Xianfuyuplasma coldseepsis]|uniref:NAD-dependent malic enzyme n=1 Tax=Candidatus Xianfuyuplasma coldseepsis TaxID=2782163 RepID=A0A7L7KQE0_9MOLU|nr:malic enzyme-like NAD(P)-binding protein [Xianfuyuplasma coldseepsis]QMS85010.1 NAD-dependent malic enzyme [Xianfuyuplasma coldseepsis]
MDNLKERSLQLHKERKGKISVVSKVSVHTNDDLSLAYSPGVAEPCKAIQEDPNTIYDYTTKGNMVAVVSDGSAVLGLGNIGPYAGLPVMEGKALLFKEFANVDAFPIMLDTQDPDEIVQAIKHISPGFGGINLEDINAPKCVYIERRLKEELDIPVFHDDQHGTAIVTLAALINACRLTDKRLEDLKIVICGTGAAGSSIARLLHKVGITELYGFNKQGVLLDRKYNDYSFLDQDLLEHDILLSPDHLKEDSLAELIKDKDVFIGVSVKNILTKEMIQTMNPNPFIFAMANPDPEITYEDAKAAGAKIIGTGRSDYPNQINNVLAFPGLFRGALDARAKNITDEMKIASAKAIAAIINDSELRDDYIIPSPFDKRVVKEVAHAVQQEALKEKDTR